MAIDGTVTAGSQFQLGFSEEAVFGTAITATTSDIWKLLHLTEHSEWDLSGLVRDTTMRLRASRVPHNEDNFFVRGGGEVVIPFTAIATDITLDFLLYLVMQDLDSEDVADPYEKIFEWDGSTTQPQFTDDTGKFVTVVLNGGIASEDMIATTCILRDLTISSDPGTNGGRLTVSGNFISGFTSATKFFESGSQDFGVATQPGTDYYHHALLQTKTIGGADMIVESYSITLNNKAVRIGSDANGDCESYALGGSGGYELTGSIRLLYDDNTKGLLTNSLTTAFDTALVLAYGGTNDPITTDGELLFKVNAGFSAVTKDFAAETGTMVDLSFTGFDDGTNEMFEAEIANAVDRSW